MALTGLGHASASNGSGGDPLLTNNCVDPWHPEVFRASVCSLWCWGMCSLEAPCERVGSVPGGDGFCLILAGLGSFGWLRFSQRQKRDIKLLNGDTKEVLTGGKKAFCSFCGVFFFFQLKLYY